MAEERAVWRVEDETPDLAVDAATEVVLAFEAAGFRLEDYTWPVRRPTGPSTVELVFQAIRDGASVPVVRPREAPRRDTPGRDARNESFAVLAVVLVILALLVFAGWSERQRERDEICSIPDIELPEDYCR